MDLLHEDFVLLGRGFNVGLRRHTVRHQTSLFIIVMKLKVLPDQIDTRSMILYCRMSPYFYDFSLTFGYIDVWHKITR